MKTPFYIKLYTFSIVFEPLLFFILGDQSYTGISLNIGRVFQLFFIVYLFIIKLPLYKINILDYKYFYFFVYFFISVFAILIGFSHGIFNDVPKYDINYASGLISRVVRSNYFRPFFEYFILFYNFVFFVILPQFIFKNKYYINYLYKIFKRVFIFCLFIGYFDLIVQFFFNLEFLPRDMSEGRTVGFRFHGIAGEPRDAFVYLVFSLGVLTLLRYFLFKKYLPKIVIYFSILASLLTQSLSGLFGIFIGFIFLAVKLLREISIKNLFLILFVFVLFLSIIYVSFISSQRIQDYYEAFENFYQILRDGETIPPLIAPQMVNVYPIWDLYIKAIQGNFIPLFFGNGFGSASAINLKLGNGFWGSLSNPHSQLVRLVYESGLIGTLVFSISFILPISKLLNTNNQISVSFKRYILFISFLILGLNLGQRSTTLFIYFGIFLMLFNNFKFKYET